MTTIYSAALHRLDEILKFFDIVAVVAVFIAAIHYAWWFALVGLAAGCATDIIRTSASESLATAGASEDDEFANESERGEACAFACKFLKLSNLLAVTTLAVGLLLGNPWWGNLLAATVAWFLGLFGIALLCAPEQHGESVASVILEYPHPTHNFEIVTPKRQS